MKQLITRKGSFDFGHRIMNHAFKCGNFHGHRGEYELVFEIDSTAEDVLGYPIDFAEIKRIGCNWIDDNLDHRMILNPLDVNMIELCRKEKSQYYTMSLVKDSGFCNPSAENISKEIFLSMRVLFRDYEGIIIKKVRFYETANCYVECMDDSLAVCEIDSFMEAKKEKIRLYVSSKKTVNYEKR